MPFNSTIVRRTLSARHAWLSKQVGSSRNRHREVHDRPRLMLIPEISVYERLSGSPSKILLARSSTAGIQITRCAEDFSRRKSHGDRSPASQDPGPSGHRVPRIQSPATTGRPGDQDRPLGAEFEDRGCARRHAILLLAAAGNRPG